MRKGTLTLLLIGCAVANAAPGGKAKKPAPRPRAAAPVPAPAAEGDGYRINGVTYTGSGAAAAAPGREQLVADQALRLKKIFLFPSIDDLSGALAPKLDDRLADLFRHNTRFELVRDPQVVKALSPDEASYYKAALSAEVHKEAARVTGADTTVLLRTRNVGPDTRMTLELRDARGNLLFAEEGSVPGISPLEERGKLVEKLYRSVLSRLPFEGTVTGRTAATITVDLGLGSMRQGEEIEIARIVSAQRHPLLGTVVGTDYVRTGRARVTTVDRVLSFAEVTEEFTGEKISPGQKVLRAQATLVHRGDSALEKEPANDPNRRDIKPLKRGGDDGEDRIHRDESPKDERLKGEFDRPKARYGQAGVNLYYGSLSHDQTLNGAESPYSGSGIGGALDGELWVTKQWILSASYAFHGATLSPASGTDVGSTRWSEATVAGGYRIFPEGLAEGVMVTASLGYQLMRFDIPAVAALTLGGKRYSGLMLKVDGDVNFLEHQKLTAGFSFQPFSSVTEEGPSLGTPGTGTVIGLSFSYNRLLLDQLWLRLGVHYDVANAGYDPSTSAASDKRFAIGPGIYYLF